MTKIVFRLAVCSAIIAAAQLAGIYLMAQAAGSVAISPKEIDFGLQPVGVATQPRTVTLTNVSTANVTIRDITPSGIDFSETNDCPGSLSPGTHCTIQLTFTPAISGPRLGTAIITDSDPVPIFLSLTGTGQ